MCEAFKYEGIAFRRNFCLCTVNPRKRISSELVGKCELKIHGTLSFDRIDPRNSRFLEDELLSIIKFSSLAGTSIDL